MTYEVSPHPGGVQITDIQVGDYIHFNQPTGAVNWSVSYNATYFKYLGADIIHPGGFGWTMEVIKPTLVAQEFTFHPAGGPPINFFATVIYIAASLLIASGSLVKTIEGIGQSAFEEPGEFVPYGPTAFQRGGFQHGAFQ